MAEYSAIYEDAIDRITSVYASCSKSEQKLLMDILTEMSQTGYSYTLEKVWLADYREIPVGIDQFVCDPYYLGATNSAGASVYDFWKETFRNIFNAGNQYNEILLSGATRIGKTSSAVTIMAYMLYKLMLYRDPHQYFNKKAISKFTIAFANLTKELAAGVAFHEFNTTLKETPWFQDHGIMNRSVSHPVYIPEGDKIDIVPASDSAHLLGMQVWACLLGDTLVVTDKGNQSLSSLADQSVKLKQFNVNDGSILYIDANVKKTKEVTDWMKIELEDGTIVEGTFDHLIMLSNGEYKPLGELTYEDDIMTNQEMQWHKDIESIVPNHMEEGDWRFIYGSTVHKNGTLRPIAVCSSGKWVILVSHDFGGNHGIKKVRALKFHDYPGPDDGHHYYQSCTAGMVHRLVARAFLSDWDPKLQVNHKDGIRDNNDVRNLEMVTTQENTRHYWESDCFDDTRKRISDYRHTLHPSAETIAKLKVACKGWKQSEDAKSRISASKMGHNVSQNCREKIRQTLLTTHGTQKCCYFKDEPNLVFHSTSKACEHIGRWSGYIGEALKRGSTIYDSNNNPKEIVFIKLEEINENQKYI